MCNWLQNEIKYKCMYNKKFSQSRPGYIGGGGGAERGFFFFLLRHGWQSTIKRRKWREHQVPPSDEIHLSPLYVREFGLSLIYQFSFFFFLYFSLYRLSVCHLGGEGDCAQAVYRGTLV